MSETVSVCEDCRRSTSGRCWVHAPRRLEGPQLAQLAPSPIGMPLPGPTVEGTRITYDIGAR